ncbi:hypothetical protein LTR53_003901 [Teratosphaeriaceae sp. CCFEE 6253]|nr:hypothetical protein LTR53_003901 [Teratosphaeriaceae sp. CCFEE 6253]
MVMFETYGEIDLNEDPCIFTSCDHIFTRSSMDGIMDMAKHYLIDSRTGNITGLKDSAEPFSSDELKSCPTCRGSLRNIARYGRIIRRSLLDESAKKLTAWSNKTHNDLAERLAAEQEHLLTTLGTALKLSQDIELRGTLPDQLRAITRLKTNTRYRKAFAIRNAIQTFADKLCREEQPYQRNSNVNIAEFTFTEAELQLREHVQASSLLIRCDTVIFSDVISMHKQSAVGRVKRSLQVGFSANRIVCDQLVQDARDTHSVRQEVEGHLFWARFAAVEYGISINAGDDDQHAKVAAQNEALNYDALKHLEEADKICARFAGLIAPTATTTTKVPLPLRRITMTLRRF